MIRVIGSLALVVLQLIVAPARAEAVGGTAAQIYAKTCASCHGTRLQGGQGPSLLAGTLIHGSADDAVAQTIRNGYPERGMPAWRSVLAESEIESLVQFIGEQRAENSPEHLASLDTAQKQQFPRILKSELYSFRAEIIAEIGKPWGLAFLPDGRLLVTEEAGGLRVIEHGRLLPTAVRDTPTGDPKDIFGRVLLDVAVHPDFNHNGWIYLTCGDSVTGADGKAVTEVTLVRGRLRDNAWTDSRILAHIATDSTITGRMAFDGKGHLFLTTASEAGINEATSREPIPQQQLLTSAPQDLRDPNGKILRFNDDGSIPADNPFAGTPGAYAPIWSYGHRNSQGLAIDPATGSLWASEHGPRGGDELNLIESGHNYGWPVISYGTRYDGIAFTTEVARPGMEQPVLNWTPSIAVSAIAFYQGREFPSWNNDLLVGSLRQERLLRLVLSGKDVVLQELIAKDLGRIRGIAISQTGDIYLALELRAQGLIVRLRKVD
jgi:glucose/arabinose dehydrogenase